MTERGGKFCTHGKIKYYCKECGGSSFCTHGKRKSECKECGGSRFCIHGKRKSECKECGGSRFCTHDRIKYRCKVCKDPCPHSKKMYTCTQGCYESLAKKMLREATGAASAAI
jgi:hypothetical protein